MGCIAPESSRENSIKKSVPQVFRVELGSSDEENAYNLIYFIETGATTEPMVCLADNDGYPEVVELFAHYMKLRGKNGVRVAVIFHKPARGKGISINLFQPGMTSHYKVKYLGESLPNKRVVK